MAKSNSCLLFKELLIVIGNFNTVNGFFITVYICDNLFCVIGLNLDKTLFKLITVINIYDRLKETHSDTACDRKRCFGRTKQSLDRRINLCGSCGNSAAALSDNYFHAQPSSLSFLRISTVLDGVRLP